jgi:hypothetical protein
MGTSAIKFNKVVITEGKLKETYPFHWKKIRKKLLHFQNAYYKWIIEQDFNLICNKQKQFK